MTLQQVPEPQSLDVNKAWKVKLTPPGHPRNNFGPNTWQADLYRDPPEKPLKWCAVEYGATRDEALFNIRLASERFENPPDVEWVAI